MKVIAVGNPLYGDDGVGAAVLARIEREHLLPDAVLVDVHTDALAVIDHFTPDGLHVIIDAAKMGEQPGRVVRFTPDEVRLRIKWDHLSLHGFGLAETFAMAESIGEMPERVVIIGVEPETIQIDRGLSDAVASAIPEVIATILAEVQRDAAEDHPRH